MKSFSDFQKLDTIGKKNGSDFDVRLHKMTGGDSMGYRIDYGPVKKVRGVEKCTSRVAALTGMFLLLFVITVCAFWPEGTAVLRDWILPGDPAVTAAAMEELTDSLRTGEELSDSLRAFWVRILEGADLAASG